MAPSTQPDFALFLTWRFSCFENSLMLFWCLDFSTCAIKSTFYCLSVIKTLEKKLWNDLSDECGHKTTGGHKDIECGLISIWSWSRMSQYGGENSSKNAYFIDKLFFNTKLNLESVFESGLVPQKWSFDMYGKNLWYNHLFNVLKYIYLNDII